MTETRSKKIVIGADHAGFELKESVKNALGEQGFDVVDIGTNSTDSTDYPDYAHELASKLSDSSALGVLVCGTGVGMSMAANRHNGVRAVVCSDTFSARMARRHNDANVLCLGSRVVGPGLADDILEAFLGSAFEGGRHQRRVGKIEL